MRKPCVFVSSTCYDLKQVRADMKHFLEGLGLEPLLSEFSSFPVNPDVGTVDNCLSVVENKADIFVLIVGPKYGSTTEAGKSVTNLEFLGARAKGIPIFVFVAHSVLNSLLFWKANPQGDFSGVTDCPKLFEFVAGIKESGDTWIFPFELAQDIFDILQTQIAYLFMDSLELRKKLVSSGAVAAKFRDLKGTLLRLIIERPRAWEYLLLSESLEGELANLGNLKKDWQYGIVTGKGPSMTPSQFCNVWVQSKFSELLRTIENIRSLIYEAFPAAVGPPGVSGDPEAILYVANRLSEAYRAALEWKLDFRRIALPEEMRNLRSTMERFCDNMIIEVEKFSHNLKESLSDAIQRARTGQPVKIELTLELTMPDQSEFKAELARVLSLVQSGALRWE